MAGNTVQVTKRYVPAKFPSKRNFDVMRRAMERRKDAMNFSCGPGVVAVALPGPPVEVWWSSWDNCADCLLPWRNFSLLALPGDSELLAAGLVASRINGLFQPYLVVRQGLSLVICLLDFNLESSHALAEITLHGCFPAKKKKYLSHPEKIIEDCWLVDGPTVVAMCHGRILVASPQSLERIPDACHRGSRSGFSSAGNHVWRAQVLVPQSRDKKEFKLLFCGDLRGNAGVEAVCVSLPLAAKGADGVAQSNDCFWFSLLLDSIGDPAIMTTFHGAEAVPPGWRNAPVDLVTRGCPELAPAGVHPSSISCMAIVPSPGVDGYVQMADVDIDVVLGTFDKRLIRCRQGQVLSTLKFEEAPSSVNFAVVGGGQGILLVSFKNAEGSVVAICAETHKKLKSWIGISGIVVADLQMLGHDQALLFPNFQYWHSDSALEDQKCIVITDFVTSVHIGSKTSLSESEWKSYQDLPTAMTDSIFNSLNSRIDAGIVEFKDVEEERSRKMDLLRSSCRLLQNFQTRCTKLDCFHGHRSHRNDHDGVHVTKLCQKIHGHTWFLIVDLESRLVKGAELHDLSLVITTLHGVTVGQSSVLRSLLPGNCEQLVATAPLVDLLGLASLVVNVLLTGMASFGSSIHSQIAGCDICPVVTDEDSRGSNYNLEGFLYLPTICGVSSGLETDAEVAGKMICNQTFTRWLSNLELALYPYGECFQPKDFRAVAKRQQLVISSETEHQLSALPALVKSVLGMEDGPGTDCQDSRVHEFVAPAGTPYAEISAVCFNKVAVLSLRSEDLRQLLAMERCLTAHLQHGFKFLPRECVPETSVQVGQFGAQLMMELDYSYDFHAAKTGTKRTLGGSRKVEPWTLSSLQLDTDRLCSHFVRP